MQTVIVSALRHPGFPRRCPEFESVRCSSSVQGAAKTAASAATGTATSLATSAASYTGLGHSHAEEHLHSSTLPPDATVGKVDKVDAEALAIFEDEGVRHDVLVKINQLAM